jgi:ECF sigma factor
VNDFTRILNSVEYGHPQAAGELLRLVCEGLQKLVAMRMVQERRGHT